MPGMLSDVSGVEGQLSLDSDEEEEEEEVGGEREGSETPAGPGGEGVKTASSQNVSRGDTGHAYT